MADKKPLTYIDYLNIYYRLSIPAELKSNCNSLFLGLLQKANMLRLNGNFPKSFTLTNHEAQILSGIINSQTFYRTREILCAFKFNGIWLVKYDKPPHSSQCGRYTLNLAYFESHYRIESIYVIQNDSQSNSQSDSQPSNQSDNIIRIEENRNMYMQSESWEAVKILIERWCPPVLHNLNERDIQMLNEILEYPYEKIEPVILHAGDEHIGYRKFLKYVIGGLETFDYHYGGKDKPVEAPKPKQLTSEELDYQRAVSQLKQHKLQFENGDFIKYGGNPTTMLILCNKMLGLLDKHTDIEKDIDSDRAYWESQKAEWVAKGGDAE